MMSRLLSLLPLLALGLLEGTLAASPAALQEEKVVKGAAPCRTLRPSSDPVLQPLLAKYEFAEKEFPWQLREIRQGEKYALSWLTFPSALKTEIPENNTVWCRYWEPKKTTGRRPAALLLHWLGGSYDALEIVGQRLAENGIDALMMYMPEYGPRRPQDPVLREKLMKRDMERSLTNLRQSVLDTRRAGDWLASRPGIEPSRVGIVGISLGAIVGSLAAGVDDRFGRSVFMIGGGDLPAIILNGSKETAAAKAKLEEAGLTADRLREMWVDIEPCTFASRIRRDDILMINAESDEVIPKAATVKLHRAMGEPEIRWFKGGHYALIFQLGPALKDMIAHLSARTAF